MRTRLRDDAFHRARARKFLHGIINCLEILNEIGFKVVPPVTAFTLLYGKASSCASAYYTARLYV